MKWLNLLLPLTLLFGSCSLLVDFDDDQSLKETICDDGVDNDEDTRTDCDDQDCWEDEACTAPNINNFNNVVNPEICNNDIDDDHDGFYDCGDEDCITDPACQGQREICDNGDDDDGDGMVDCDDSECFGIEGCNNPGEFDCGNAYDDDGDGMVDCADPDCFEALLCREDYPPCNRFIDFTANIGHVFYYRDIYQFGVSSDCGDETEFYCGIKPEHSMVPHCYPLATSTVVPAFAPCDQNTVCGTGLVCTTTDFNPMSPKCLPLCAPGLNTECVNNQGVCFIHWINSYDNIIDKDIELWLCEKPACNPMNPGNSGCTPSTAACYPETNLFGNAACHPTAGLTALNLPCPNGDTDCIPGSICRWSDDVSMEICHKLCGNDTPDCTNINSGVCQKDDSRQLYGYCK
ncbi:hypothetical protein KJ612_05610 [Myxococcota bacterium]|nr:hypothetical protein [Myxococcota bacterium]